MIVKDQSEVRSSAWFFRNMFMHHRKQIGDGLSCGRKCLAETGGIDEEQGDCEGGLIDVLL